MTIVGIDKLIYIGYDRVTFHFMITLVSEVVASLKYGKWGLRVVLDRWDVATFELLLMCTFNPLDCWHAIGYLLMGH